MKLFVIRLTIILLLAAPALADDIRPTNEDKCAVCGMFVYKYPDWQAYIEFKDGTRKWFDGAKDAFKYYLSMDRYSASRKISDIKYFIVTEYYDLSPIDSKEAHYVLGSDVYGPMGRELVPFKAAAAAEEFMRDHNGERILTFDEVTPDIVTSLDQ